MRVRLVHVTVKRSGARALREEIVEAERLTVGRGTDNQLQIPSLTVALHHAVFARYPGGLRIEVRDATELEINGVFRSSATLEPGDLLAIGPYELRVLQNEPGEDLALEIECVGDSASERAAIASRTRIGVERGLFSRSFLSWASALAILGALLILPALGSRRAVQRADSASDLRATAQLVQATWSVGRISRNHGMIAGQCESCHAQPFTPVRNAECLQCHADVGAHVRPGIACNDTREEACTACHQEHRGDAGLTSFNDGLCVQCHRDIRAACPKSELGNVTGFSTTGHPEFSPWVIAGRGDRGPQRVALARLLRPGIAQSAAVALLRERSGLEFSHRIHLDPDLRSPVQGPVKLRCDSCHENDPAGRLMGKVDFAKNCRWCHSLGFALGEPERQAPHHEPPAKVREAIEEFFAARELLGKSLEPPLDGEARWRPGERRDELAHLTPPQRAVYRAQKAADVLMGRNGPCEVCHTLERDGDAIQVDPVVLMPVSRDQRWLPYAGFTHQPREHQECKLCHDAAHADSAEEVLLPGIDTCVRCHGGEDAPPGRVASGCLTCHEFHHARLGPMQTASGTAPGGTAVTR